jgi:hypothetical protein
MDKVRLYQYHLIHDPFLTGSGDPPIEVSLLMYIRNSRYLSDAEHSSSTSISLCHTFQLHVKKSIHDFVRLVCRRHNLRHNPSGQDWQSTEVCRRGLVWIRRGCRIFEHAANNVWTPQRIHWGTVWWTESREPTESLRTVTSSNRLVSRRCHIQVWAVTGCLEVDYAVQSTERVSRGFAYFEET